MTGSKSVLAVASLLCCGLIVTGCSTIKSRTGGGKTGGSFNPEGVSTTVEPDDKPLVDQPTEFGIPIKDVSFENVMFDFDKAQVNRSEYAKIESVADYLKRNSGTKVVLDGHCDERGTADYNLSLGERRSIAVRDHMTGLGIETTRVFTRSFGEEKPVNDGHDESAWQANRRVEFSLYR